MENYDSVFTITEEDVQFIAEERIGRELTRDEMDSFKHKFNIEDWSEQIEYHIDLALEDSEGE